MERFKVGVLFSLSLKLILKLRSEGEMGSSAAVREKEGEGTSRSFPEERVQPQPVFEKSSKCETIVCFPEEGRGVTRQ